MSRIRNGRNGIRAGLLIPGSYQQLSDKQYRGQDPRCYLDPEGNVAEVQAALAVRSPLLDRFAAGEPVVVSRWQIERRFRRGIPWLEGVGTVRVHPNDVVEPTDDPADAM